MSPDQETSEVIIVGHVTFNMLSDGTVDVDVEGMMYMQLYGCAGILAEMARQGQAEDTLRRMAHAGKRIVVPTN